MTREKPPDGFVPLASVRGGPPDPAAAIAELRRIYFRTSRETIEADFAHAIALLKSIPDEEMRSKAHVFMEGIAEMRNQWAKKAERRREAGAKRKKKGAGNTIS